LELVDVGEERHTLLGCLGFAVSILVPFNFPRWTV
jgi:hypothetical protein